MALKLTGATSQTDPAWDFRFMLDPIKSTEEYRKYKNRDFCSKDFQYAPRQEEQIVHIYSMMTDDYLIECIQHLIRENSYGVNSSERSFLQKVLGRRVQRPMSEALVQAIISHSYLWSSTTIGLGLAQQLISNQTVLDYIDIMAKNIQENPQPSLANDDFYNVLFSFCVLKGDAALRVEAQQRIAQLNLANSLEVLKYAEKMGLVAPLANQNEIFTSHFREGKIHKESIRLLKKNKEEVKEYLQATDKLFHQDFQFQQGYGYSELDIQAWALGINLLYQKDPKQAIELFDMQEKNWRHLYYDLDDHDRELKTRYTDWTKNRFIKSALPLLMEAGPAFYQNESIQGFLRQCFRWSLSMDLPDKTYIKMMVNLPYIWWVDMNINYSIDNSYCPAHTERAISLPDMVRTLMNVRYDLNLPVHRTIKEDDLLDLVENTSFLNKKEKIAWKQWRKEHPNDLGEVMWKRTAQSAIDHNTLDETELLF